jgi:ubiquitin-like protein Pup
MATFIKKLTTESRRNRSDEAVDPIPLYMTMAAGEQKQKAKGGDDGGDEESGEGGQKMAEKGEELKEEMDNLLDEIDSVLEENAEEFVKNYVQRGGE